MSDLTCKEFEQYVHRVYDERLAKLDSDIKTACDGARKLILDQVKSETELFTRNVESRLMNERAEKVAQAKLHADTIYAQAVNALQKETYQVFLSHLESSSKLDSLFESFVEKLKVQVKKDGVLLKDCTISAWNKVNLKTVDCTLTNPLVQAETKTTVYEYSLIDWFNTEFIKEVRQ